MRKIIFIFLIVACIASCKKDQNEKRGIDFGAIASEMNLSEEKEKQYKDIVTKYAKQRDEIMATAKRDKSSTTATMNKLQNVLKNQTQEVSAILDVNQMKVYNKLVEKIRKMRNPGYTKELITKIVSDLGLSEDQAKMLNVANKAFEKSYIDAHDYYHGNNEAAKEYWNRFDIERKNAIKTVLTKEQYQQFLEIVKDFSFKGEHG